MDTPCLNRTTKVWAKSRYEPFRAHEKVRMVVAPHDQSTPRCPACRATMQLWIIFPRLDVLPELLLYRCAPCGATLRLADDRTGDPAERISSGLDVSGAGSVLSTEP
jgi:hypothetical protein